MAINKGKIRTAAQRYAEKGNYDRAIDEYRKIVKDDPADAHVLLKIGEMFAKKGDRESALTHFKKSAELFFQQGFDVKAAGVLKQVLAIDPTDVESSIGLARYYKTKGMIVDALAHLEAVYRWLVKHERNDQALELAKEMVTLDPDNVAMRIRLAEAYSRQDRRSEAVAEFAVAADLLREADRIDDFIKVAERLLWHQPDNVAISKELATLYLRKKEPRRALQKLQVCFKSNPQDVETLELLAEAFEQLEQTAKAATILKELAKIFLAQNRRDDALDVYARVLAFAPGDQEAKAAVASLKPGRPSEAFHQVHTLPVAGEADQPPQTRDAFDESAEPLLLDDDDVEELSDDAIVEVEEDGSDIARILSETDVFVRYRLFDKALAHLEQVLDRWPDHVEAMQRLAEVFAESGRIPEAVDAYRKLADILVEADAEAAGRALGQALSLVPDDEELAREYERVTGRAAPKRDAIGADAFEDEFSDLSGLELLEDIEAEAEDGDSVYATQELSFQGRKSPFRRGAEAGDSEEVDLGEMADLGLLDDLEESGDLVDLGALADAAVFGDSDVSPDATIPQNSLTAGDVLKAAGERDRIAPDATLSDMGGGLTASEVSAAAQGDSDESSGVSDEDDAVVFSDDLDLELDRLEEEFGDLSAPGADEKDEAETPGEGNEADTAMVSMEAFEAALEEDAGKEGDADLDLMPPPAEFDDDEVSGTLDGEDLLGDELEQLEETGALIARLEKESGHHEIVKELEGTAPVSRQPKGEVETAVAESELDFSGLMDEEPMSESVEPQEFRDEAADASSFVPESGESSPRRAGEGPDEPPVEDAFDALVDAAESALSDMDEPPVAGAEEQGRDEAADIGFGPEKDRGIATSELQIEDLAQAWAESGQMPTAGEPVDVDEVSGADEVKASTHEGEDIETAVGAEAVETEEDEETIEALQADIEDTEFFIEQGLYHDALEMLEELREQYGDHPLLIQKIEEVRSAAGREFVAEDDDEENIQEAAEAGVQNGVPIEKAVKQSVKVVGATGEGGLAEGDAETHFDLGIAYRDMGLLDQAIDEFRKVTMTPSRAVQAHLMIAGCLKDMGRLEDAVAECEAALAVETITKAERLETHYQLGNLWEASGERAKAEEAFQKILDEAPSYRDVEERLGKLRS